MARQVAAVRNRDHIPRTYPRDSRSRSWAPASKRRTPLTRGASAHECVTLLTPWRPSCARVRTAMRTAVSLLRTSVYLYTQFRIIVISRSWADSRTDGPPFSFRLFVAGERFVQVPGVKCESEFRGASGITQLGLRPRATRVYILGCHERARLSGIKDSNGSRLPKNGRNGAVSPEKNRFEVNSNG